MKNDGNCGTMERDYTEMLKEAFELISKLPDEKLQEIMKKLE